MLTKISDRYVVEAEHYTIADCCLSIIPKPN